MLKIRIYIKLINTCNILLLLFAPLKFNSNIFFLIKIKIKI